ncbi:tRNA (adenosine(37)-N6)-dimethylallyltransferase MiaA [soil metagenome]
MKPTLIVVGGATATGKTSLAIELAQQFNTAIISADSRQCYREISIGTAKPTAEELSLVPHHFINSHSIQDYFSSGIFAIEATKIIDQLFTEHQVIILVGGSGLYIKALLEGLDDLPEVSAAIRAELKSDYQEKGLAELLEELKKSDPEYFSKVDQHNHARVIRALEVIRSSGLPYSSFLGKKSKEKNFNTVAISIQHPREILYERINRRVDQMINDGLVSEAETVSDYRNHPALRTVGYKELFQYFDGTITLEEAILQIKQHTRNYAKRQETWFRHQADFKFITAEDLSKRKDWLNF